MKGSRVQKHPSKKEIEDMLRVGNTPEEVSNWLKQKYHHRRYWLSGVTLTEYRNNYMQMTREQASAKRKELQAEGKTAEANSIGIYETSQELIEAQQQAAKQVIDVMNNFKSMQNKIADRIAFMDQKTRDADGNPTYKARDEEILQGWMTQLRGMTMDFVKASNDIKKQETENGNVGISITVAEMSKYKEAFKAIFQKILIKLDPSLINDALQIYAEEMGKVEGSGNEVSIKVSSGNSSSNISIITSGSQIPETNSESISIDMSNQQAEVIEAQPVGAQNKENN